ESTSAATYTQHWTYLTGKSKRRPAIGRPGLFIIPTSAFFPVIHTKKKATVDHRIRGENNRLEPSLSERSGHVALPISPCLLPRHWLGQFPKPNSYRSLFSPHEHLRAQQPPETHRRDFPASACPVRLRTNSSPSLPGR